MMRLISSLLLGAALVGAAVPATAASPREVRGEAQLAKALEGRVAGKPVDCLSLHRIRSSRVIDGTAILYDAGRTVYVNRPTSGQSTLDSDDVLVTKTHSSELCSIDTVQLYSRGGRFWSGFVGLGQFVPYTRVRAER